MEGETEGDALRSMTDLVTPMAVRVAATLRVANHIKEGLRTAIEIAEAASSNPDALDRLLRHLASVDVLSRDASGRYALTALGEALCDDHPSGMRAVLDIDGAVGRAELSLVHLLHSVRTGEASFPLLYGRGFWADLASDPDRTASYDRLMGLDVAEWALHIVPAYDWGSLGYVVGGGNGTLLAALLQAHTGLRGTVFDQPATVEAARTTLAAAGFADRTEVVAGSFFDPLPPGADGYILSAILHDWNSEPASEILRRCAQAAGSTGKVFVIEKTGPDGESPSSAMDLRLLGYFGGGNGAWPKSARSLSTPTSNSSPFIQPATCRLSNSPQLDLERPRRRRTQDGARNVLLALWRCANLKRRERHTSNS